MKKLFALLLAFAVVGGAFAQVTTAISLSGSAYIERMTVGDGDILAKLSPNGATYDTLKFKADKEGKYGFELYEKNVLADGFGAPDAWNVWYQYDLAKVTVGFLDGGSYVQYFNNGWIENYDPQDKMTGKGVLAESKDFGGLKVAFFMPLNGGLMSDEIQKAAVGLSYTIADTATIVAQANLDIIGEATSINAGFDFTGVAKLDVYGWGEYDTAGDGTVGFGVGGQYKEATWRAGAEFEGQSATDLAFDVVANFRYYITPTFFAQVRPYFYSASNGMDGRYAVRAYANYAFGNGLAIEPMVGYDAKPDAAQEASLIHYVRLTYSVSF